MPWLVPRSTLPDNYESALKSLISTEKSLKKNPGWGEVYGEQVRDMCDRGAAVKLSPEQLREWKGTTHYIPHLVVQNPASRSTPVRLVFDASRAQNGEGVCDDRSGNSCGCGRCCACCGFLDWQ